METYLLILLTLSVFVIARYFVFTGTVFAYFYKIFPKKYAPNKIQQKAIQPSQILSEIKHSMLSSVAFASVGSFVSFTSFKDYTKIYTNIHAYSLWWIPASLLIAFVIHDTYFYWMHRFFHHPKVFRFTHFIHHKYTNPSPWASHSFNLVEAYVEAFVIIIIVSILPMHRVAIFMFAFTSFVVNIYGHLGYELAPQWLRNSFLFKMINTSVYHNMHHSKFKGNYSLYFRFWDKVMKTEIPHYEKLYDEIQEKRFTKASKTSKQESKPFPKAAIFLFCLLPYTASSQIEGKWLDKSTGAVVQIYKEQGKFIGKALKAGNTVEDQKLASKNVIVLNNFEQKNTKTWCCGDIFMPRRKLYAKGDISLLNASTLQITGYYLAFTKSFIWHKVE